MDLWIMSQDEEKLMEVKEVLYQKGTFEDKDANAIVGCPFYDDNAVLGIYESKKRALEVLREIDDIKFYKYMASLDLNIFVNITKQYPEEERLKLFNSMNTYEMPKE